MDDAYNTTVGAYEQAINQLPQQQRFLFKGHMQEEGYSDPFSTAKDLAERWPDDPVFAADYAAEAIGHFKVGQWSDRQPMWSPHDLAQTLAILDRGQKLEPDNGYYALLRAAMLMEAGSEELYDSTDDSLAFTYRNGRGQEETNHLVTARIIDREQFERGLASLHEAAGKRYVQSHVAELANHRLAALPAPSRLSNEVVRIEFARNMYVPYDHYFRDAVNRAGAFALELASERQVERARSILDDEATVTRHVAEGARFNEEEPTTERGTR